MKEDPWKIMMVAGEASGDFLGAELLSAVKNKYPDALFLGVGGDKMRRLGVDSPFDTNHLSVIGIAEVVLRLPDLIRVFRYLLHVMDVSRPHLLITIDLPDFNFLLAKRARARGIPVLHYVSPQVWAWRSGRAQRLQYFIDHLLVLFPFEAEIYARTNLPVTFVGHPLVHQALPWSMRTEGVKGRNLVRHQLGIGSEDPWVILLPGSRHSEVSRLLAPMVRACQLLKIALPAVRFAIARATTLTDEDILRHWPSDCDESFKREVPILAGATYDLLASADAALVTSGTATLEAALIQIPQVVCYRVNNITYAIGKRLVNVPFISLVNLVAGHQVVQERLQHAAEPQTLCRDLIGLLQDGQTRESIQAGYQTVRDKLTRSAASPFAVVEAMLAKGSGRKQVPDRHP
ncbi:MAG: lipid-A-disaccharide synthase [Magnetococcales bacterium]|nr:lipid-A-disaccharide synthase [Magnetococcales bacterium]